MNPQVVDNANKNLARTFRAIHAAKDTQKLPTQIEIIKAGEWPDDSNKGFMKITTADLLEFKKNFDEGIGMPGGAGFGLPIDFSHEEWDKAAGWIKEVVVEGDTLYGKVEWSKSGEESLMNGEFKCISPSFYPSCLGSWHDPEDWSETAQNVLVGAGLTNIPFFKGLKPIMASNASGERSGEDKNLIYVSASEKENNMLTLEEIRAKDADALSEEEKSFLVEHKAELTAEEQTKFGFEVTAKGGEGDDDGSGEGEGSGEGDGEDAAAAVTPELAAVQADLKSGKKVLVEASTLNRLEKVADQYELEKANQKVEAHVARGAIKADQAKVWADRIVKDPSVEALMQDLPNNEALAGEQGSSVKASETGSAIAQVQTKANELVEASEGKKLDIGSAISQVLANNKELATQYNEEKRGDK
jgi:hypothetical protein